MSKPKQQSAFPDPMRGAEASVYNQTPHQESEGMTLRDYFAAKAIQVTYMGVSHEVETARRAYELADAMLKEREKATGDE